VAKSDRGSGTNAESKPGLAASRRAATIDWVGVYSFQCPITRPGFVVFTGPALWALPTFCRVVRPPEGAAAASADAASAGKAGWRAVPFPGATLKARGLVDKDPADE
jgi:hypothetical protein